MHAQEKRERGIILELLKGPIPYRPLMVRNLDGRTALNEHELNGEE